MRLEFKDGTIRKYQVHREGNGYRAKVRINNPEEIKKITFKPERKWWPLIETWSRETLQTSKNKANWTIRVTYPSLENRTHHFLKEAFWNVEGMSLLFVMFLLVAAQILCSMGS